MRDGWLAGERIAGLGRRRGSVRFRRGRSRSKQPLIEEAAANFLDRANDEQTATLPALLPGQSLLADRLCDVQRAAPAL